MKREQAVHWCRSRTPVGRKTGRQLQRLIVHLVLLSDIGFECREQTILGAPTQRQKNTIENGITFKQEDRNTGKHTRIGSLRVVPTLTETLITFSLKTGVETVEMFNKQPGIIGHGSKR